MSLVRSAWKKQSPATKLDDYILIVPDEHVIVSFTSMPGKENKVVVWGCWIREEPDSVVYTALRNADKWRRESYKAKGDELIWNNGNDSGLGVWNRIAETEIPITLRERGAAYLSKHSGHIPPNYEEAEQDGETDS